MALAGFALLASWLALAPAKAATPNLPALYRDHAVSLVFVRATYRHGETTTTKSSTGLVLSGGRILTKCESVRRGDNDELDVDSIEVVIGRRDRKSGMVKPDRTVPVKLIRCDRERDLAILATHFPLPKPLRLASADPTPGQLGAAMGHSWRGLPWTIHRCNVAGVGRPNRDFTKLLSAATATTTQARQKDLDRTTMLEVDCDTHPTYGSPVAAANGRVLGVLQVAHFDPKHDAPNKYYLYLAASEIRAFLDESK